MDWKGYKKCKDRVVLNGVEPLCYAAAVAVACREDNCPLLRLPDDEEDE